MNKLLLLSCILFCLKISVYSQNTESFTDERDGKVYKTVKIDNKIWMAENLNYASENSWCYNDDEKKCDKYGRLYAMDAAIKACPKGWKIPSDDDWDILINNHGTKDNVGGFLKEAGTANWKTPNVGASNTGGFTALPAGRKLMNGTYDNEGITATFWSLFKDKSNAWGRHISYDAANLKGFNSPELKAYSLRCVKE